MEYRFNDEQHKKILGLLVILIIFVVIIGGLFFYINNEKLAVMTRVDKVLNFGVNSAFDKINDFNMDNMVEDVKFKANMEQKIEDETITTEILTGNIHTNLTKENEYKIIELDSTMQGQEVAAGIYEKDGIVFLKLNGEVYQLNEEAIEVNENYNIKDIQEMYNLVYKTSKKQLKELDFYKLKDETEKVTKMGISLSDKRVKEIIIDTLSELKTNEKFIELYANIKDIEKDKVVEEVEEFIKNIEEMEMSENNVTTLEIYTSGLLNQNTDKIILTRTEEAILKFIANINVNENGANIELKQNNKTISISLNKYNEMYSININGRDYNFNFSIENYNFTVSANYANYNMYIEFEGKENDKGEIVGNGTIGVNLDENTNIIMTYEETLSFEAKEEKVELGDIKPATDLFGSLMMLNSMNIY